MTDEYGRRRGIIPGGWEKAGSGRRVQGTGPGPCGPPAAAAGLQPHHSEQNFTYYYDVFSSLDVTHFWSFISSSIMILVFAVIMSSVFRVYS